MHTALELDGYSSPELRGLLDNVRLWLEKLPDKPDFRNNGSWSCHGLTRAAKRHFQLADWHVQDGMFAEKGIEHSWLLFEGRYVRETGLVLDVSPWGGLSPFVVSIHWALPWGRLYKPDSSHFGIRLGAFDTEAKLILMFS